MVIGFLCGMHLLLAVLTMSSLSSLHRIVLVFGIYTISFWLAAQVL